MSVCIGTCCCSYSYQSMAANLALRTIDSELDAALLYSLDRDIYKKAKTSLDSSADKPHYLTTLNLAALVYAYRPVTVINLVLAYRCNIARTS